ncbi:MAG: MerR family transcriptional regulator [Acidobacteriota bacterium]|nr:MerR family transcriptional regulator [Acidobacteriota bacterium]
MTSTEIPNRTAFKSAEVCVIAGLQPYVLRTWEAEFPDLGVEGASGPRVYRRIDVERVLRLKHLILVEGLTLAGARRKIIEDAGPQPEPDTEALLPSLVPAEVRGAIQSVRGGLESILRMLSGKPGASEFAREAPPAPAKPAVVRKKKAKT